MSDVTYSRKADALTEVDPGNVPERLALANVHATQGVAKALREVDGKLKYVADQIVQALRPDPRVRERWIAWGEEDRTAVAVAQIGWFASTENGTMLHLVNGATFDVPIPFGEVALMVEAWV